MIIKTDCIEGLKSLDDESVNCIITSPPYNKKGLQGTQTKKSKKDGNQIWKKFEIDYHCVVVVETEGREEIYVKMIYRDGTHKKVRNR